MNITALKETATRSLSLAKLAIQKRSPEILIGVGIVSIVGGTIAACRATLKVESILDEHAVMMDDIQSGLDDEEAIYTEKDAQKDKTIALFKTSAKLVKNYAPSALLIGFGVGCVIGSHNIMVKRQAALLGAYNALEKAFEEYRKRVANEIGEERERDLYDGVQTIDVLDESTGEMVKESRTAGIPISPYARFFDESSVNWVNNAPKNRFTLKMIQNMANDRLKARGYLFLNEVYEMLGFPPEMNTEAGQVVGWVYGEGDGFVDFNLFRTCTNDEAINEGRRRFVNDLEPSVLLDFNVHGVIMDLVFRKKK